MLLTGTEMHVYIPKDGFTTKKYREKIHLFAYRKTTHHKRHNQQIAKTFTCIINNYKTNSQIKQK